MALPSNARSNSAHPLTGLTRPPARWAALAWTLAAAGLRVFRLGNKSVWWDEGASVNRANLTFAAMLERVAHSVNPPVYFALLRAWRFLAGDSEFALRFLSAMAGVLLLPVAYRLVRRLAGTPAALLTVGFLALSRVLVWYSQEIRAYSLAALFALASLALADRLWRRDAGARVWAGYLAVTWLGLITHYAFVTVVIAENLAALAGLWRGPAAGRRRAKVFVQWFGGQALMAATLLPWVIFYLLRLPHRDTPKTLAAPLSLLETGRLFLNTLLVGNPTAIDRFWPIMLLGAALLVIGLIVKLRTRAALLPANVFGYVALISGGAALLVAAWVFNLPWSFQWRFTLTARYFVVQIPWGLALLGVAAAAVIRRWPRAGWLASAVLLAAFAGYTANYYTDRHLADDYKSAAATLQAYRQPGDGLLLHNDRDWPILEYHVGTDWTGVNSARRIDSDALAAEYAHAVWDTHAGVWLLVTPEALVNDPQQRIYQWLAGHALAQRAYSFPPTAALYFFARTPERAATLDQLAAPPAATLNLSPAPGLTLVRAEWVLPEYRVGETLHLFLDWRNARAPGLYAFKLRLSTPSGALADEFPAALEVTAQSPDLIRQQVDLPLRAYLGGGNYALTLLAGPAWARLGSVTVIPARPHAPVAGAPAVPATARFENGIALQGYTAAAASGRVTLTLYWTTSAPVDISYKAFVHLRGPALNPATGTDVWAQEDHSPGSGRAPTTTWRVGETVTDVFTLTLPKDAPPGAYSADVGWYDFLTGQRVLAVNEAGEAIDSQTTLGPMQLDLNP